MTTMPAAHRSRATVDLSLLTAERLAELPEREFRQVVDADLKQTASNDKLRAPVPGWLSRALRNECVDRWVAALRAMLANVESQLELREDSYRLALAEAETDSERRAVTADYERGILGPKRFRAALLEAMPEAEMMLEGRVRLLERAIVAHRRTIEADVSMEPSEADRALWSILG